MPEDIIENDNPSNIITIDDEKYGELKAAQLSNGLTIMAGAMHDYVMENDERVPSNPKLSGALLSTPKERINKTQGTVQFVETTYEPDPETVKWLDQFHSKNPNVLIATSLINLNAYKHPTLVTLISTEDTKQVTNPESKRWQLGKVAVATK